MFQLTQLTNSDYPFIKHQHFYHLQTMMFSGFRRKKDSAEFRYSGNVYGYRPWARDVTHRQWIWPVASYLLRRKHLFPAKLTAGKNMLFLPIESARSVDVAHLKNMYDHIDRFLDESDGEVYIVVDTRSDIEESRILGLQAGDGIDLDNGKTLVINKVLRDKLRKVYAISGIQCK